ncbi:amino acid ABC transporter ATP-binding protein [Ochrobactrum sp. MYb15]|uniref:ABC transporter ATP-binding protein n=1 Tax=Brucella pituitosa TaxID=571256 RepID=UPI000CFCCDED|nr:amino acid ABC transporter ATP-binding protein [Ochrobactrum sp. MYb19]PRA63472.1 amino acid ABC transporter ATP-binding protein [Ochrobactrum sp. MYb18]PRA73638.1 amino acid ABC transporter ATP-binding protein [Brucella thiophenivorans]PRA86676.1 amino acid ABC transporter ATP-binding protein [Ochrobactrum sp. MYb14]PRA94694.1 amino acid ABC transporter ATP-binding protein [Ochrobactrum sp. MYb15]
MIEISNITRIYGAQTAVDNVSLTIQAGDVAVIVGTSGSGKTTLMRMINRLVEPSHGVIKIDGKDNRELPPHILRRGIGYAIQGHGLFPHRTIAENIATVPTLLGWDKAKISARVDELLSLFHLDPAIYRDRMPHELSGGQQQRIGVARALASNPAILLMDEPFGALDPIIRDKAQEDLLAIQKHYGTTIVLVTHDMEEAIRLGTRIAVMDKGKLLQYATPEEIITQPATEFVHALLGGGSDRVFRLLSLETVDGLIEPGQADGEAISSETSLREALGASLWSGRPALPVSRNGQIVGRITRTAIEDHARRVA